MLTLDFLTPLVDDPYDFGRIAAANALSDVWAMGAKPICALNILALDSLLGTEVAGEIIRGGANACAEAGCLVVGGHSIDDDEPKYGLSVFGTVDPERIVRNQGATPGDVLFLTKRLGVGICSAAWKIKIIDDDAFAVAIDSMKQLNKAGGEAMLECHVHAATDVTGFGLAGHLHEMLESSGCAASIRFNSLPLFDRVMELSEAYCRPNRTFSIMDYAADFVVQGTTDDDVFDNRMGVICDPQTSGGLLVAIPPEQADAFRASFKQKAGFEPWEIGEVVKGEAGTIHFAD